MRGSSIASDPASLTALECAIVRGVPALVIAFIVLVTAYAAAQPVAVTLTCIDRDGRVVAAVQVTNGVIAKATAP